MGENDRKNICAFSNSKRFGLFLMNRIFSILLVTIYAQNDLESYS